MASPTPPPEFDVVLRGYDRHEVEDLVTRARDSLDALSGGRGAGAPITSAELREGSSLSLVLRGYDRRQVDRHLELLADRLAQAERSAGR